MEKRTFVVKKISEISRKIIRSGQNKTAYTAPCLGNVVFKGYKLWDVKMITNL